MHLFRQNWYTRWSAPWALVAAVGLFWWLGQSHAKRPGDTASDLEASYSPPAEGAPELSRAAIMNNQAAALKLAPDLEGTAVIFPELVAGLIDPGGSFRTNDSLEQMAAILKVDPQAIRKKNAAEIDPEAVLFTVVAGHLSERAKAQSREARAEQVRLGCPPWATGHEWVTTAIHFTLSDLRHPNVEQKKLLDAISQAVLGELKQPGAKINAIALPMSQAEMRAESVAFAPGYLPLEAPAAD